MNQNTKFFEYWFRSHQTTFFFVAVFFLPMVMKTKPIPKSLVFNLTTNLSNTVKAKPKRMIEVSNEGFCNWLRHFWIKHRWRCRYIWWRKEKRTCERNVHFSMYSGTCQQGTVVIKKAQFAKGGSSFYSIVIRSERSWMKYSTSIEFLL